VIFLDTSALVAMLAREPDGSSLAARLQQAPERVTAAHVILETAMRLSSLFSLAPTVVDSRVTALLRQSSVEIVSITEDIAHIAVTAFESYGTGRGKAGLNFGDCLTYACAKAHGARLLFKGDDFTHTDIVSA
jgi:ribonuclease VapC